MALKDVKLEEKEQLLVKGEVIADSFKDRNTGKELPKRFYVDNIVAIPGELLEKLQCGDVVVKRTVSNGTDLFHCYLVTHKQATGICISYFAAGYSETVSYDKIDGVWTYNSTDIGE